MSYVDAVTAGFIRQGQGLPSISILAPWITKYVKAVSQEGELLAIGEAKLPNLYHPILVL